MTLHLLCAADQLDTCAATAAPSDFVILVGEATKCLQANPSLRSKFACELGALLFELDEGTINALDSMGCISALSDEQWVTLTEIHHKQVTWT